MARKQKKTKGVSLEKPMIKDVLPEEPMGEPKRPRGPRTPEGEPKEEQSPSSIKSDNSFELFPANIYPKCTSTTEAVKDRQRRGPKTPPPRPQDIIEEQQKQLDDYYSYWNQHTCYRCPMWPQCCNSYNATYYPLALHAYNNCNPQRPSHPAPTSSYEDSLNPFLRSPPLSRLMDSKKPPPNTEEPYIPRPPPPPSTITPPKELDYAISLPPSPQNSVSQKSIKKFERLTAEYKTEFKNDVSNSYGDSLEPPPQLPFIQPAKEETSPLFQMSKASPSASSKTSNYDLALYAYKKYTSQIPSNLSPTSSYEDLLNPFLRSPPLSRLMDPKTPPPKAEEPYIPKTPTPPTITPPKELDYAIPLPPSPSSTISQKSMKTFKESTKEDKTEFKNDVTNSLVHLLETIPQSPCMQTTEKGTSLSFQMSKISPGTPPKASIYDAAIYAYNNCALPISSNLSPTFSYEDLSNPFIRSPPLSRLMDSKVPPPKAKEPFIPRPPPPFSTSTPPKELDYAIPLPPSPSSTISQKSMKTFKESTTEDKTEFKNDVSNSFVHSLEPPPKSPRIQPTKKSKFPSLQMPKVSPLPPPKIMNQQLESNTEPFKEASPNEEEFNPLDILNTAHQTTINCKSKKSKVRKEPISSHSSKPVPREPNPPNSHSPLSTCSLIPTKAMRLVGFGGSLPPPPAPPDLRVSLSKPPTPPVIPPPINAFSDYLVPRRPNPPMNSYRKRSSISSLATPPKKK